MKYLWIAVIVVALAGCQGTGDKKVKLESQLDKVSYSIGLSIGKNLGRDSIVINQAAFLAGLNDAAVDTSKRLMSDAQVQETMMEFQKEMVAKQQENARVAGEKNMKEGQEFLAKNKQRTGVVTLPSGLQYEVITEGTGKVPRPDQTVTANYRGTLLDGTEFDSSFKRGQPATFPVHSVIPGWSQALQLMKVGAKWKLYIPSDLGYGAQGAGNVIGPNSTLVFEIELLSIK